MRRSLASSVFVLASAAALVVGLGGTAVAGPVSDGCLAVVEPPHLDVGKTNQIVATGSFSCYEAATGMTVEVCIEERYTATPESEWWLHGCTTVTEPDELRDTIEATHSISMPVYATFLRATVRGVNDAERTASSRSAPVWWFNCACYIG